MPFRLRLLALACAGVAIALGLVEGRGQSSRPASPAPAERRLPFAPGEVLEYTISWSNFLTAGTARLRVAQPESGSPGGIYTIVAEGQPVSIVAALYPLYYKVQTQLDVATLLPRAGSMYTDERGRKTTRITRFDRGKRQAHYEVQGTRSMRKTLQVPADVHDALSTLYALRAQTLAPGRQQTMTAADSGELYRVHARVAGREQVRLPSGTVTAWRVDLAVTDAKGQPAARGVHIWLADDGKRTPVRLQAELPVGTFELTLRH